MLDDEGAFQNAVQVTHHKPIASLVLLVQRMGVEAGVGGRNGDGERGQIFVRRYDDD